MPRFTYEASFNLVTEIEPDGIRVDIDGSEGVESFQDDSYFSTTQVTSDGGAFSGIIEAGDEHEARDRVENAIHSEYEDNNGFTWLVEDLNIEVEPVEEPMDLDKAKEIVTGYLMEVDLPEDVKEAFRFLLAHISVVR